MYEFKCGAIANIYKNEKGTELVEISIPSYTTIVIPLPEIIEFARSFENENI